MKITTRQISEFIQAPGQVLGTLVYGPDDGLVLRHCRSIIKVILGENYDPMNLIELSDSSLKDDPAKLADECGAMGLLGGNRLIWLRGLSEKYAELVEPCLPLLGPECYLLVSQGECGPRHKFRQIFEQHKKLAAVACYRAEGRNLTQLIQEIMAGYGQRLEPQALQFLSQELGNDAMITESELAKLSLYANDKATVTLQDARDTIIHNNEHQLDPLCQHFVNGQADKFDALWQDLIRDGQQPIVMLRSLARYVYKLLMLKLAMLEEGYSAQQAVDAARPPIFWNQKDAMARQLSRLSLKHMVYYMHLINQAECSFKLHSHAGDMAPERILMQALKKRQAA